MIYQTNWLKMIWRFHWKWRFHWSWRLDASLEPQKNDKTAAFYWRRYGMFFLLETLFRASSSHSIPFPSPCPVLYTWNFFVSNIESQVLHGKKDGDLYLFFQHSEAEVKAEAGDFSIMQLMHPPPFQTMCTPFPHPQPSPPVTLLSPFQISWS